MRSLLGAKGADLAEMTSVLGLNVPPGFTLSTGCGLAHIGEESFSPSLTVEIRREFEALATRSCSTFGDEADPLLVAVRASAAQPMPGRMETVLNIGLNDASVIGLAELTGDSRFAYDSYRRLVQMYGNLVLGVPHHVFQERFDGAKRLCDAPSDVGLPSDVLAVLVQQYQEIIVDETGISFPQDPFDQLEGAVLAAFQHWNDPVSEAYRSRERLDGDEGTAVTVQQMVFGNRDDFSGTGLAFTHDPRTGERGLYGSFAVGGQGDDVSGGQPLIRSIDELSEDLPATISGLREALARLEDDYRDMMSVEFTIESGTLWLLEAEPAVRSGPAAVRVALELTSHSTIQLKPEEAIQRVSGEHVDQILHPQFATDSRATVLATGIGTSPGAAVGQAYFSFDKALEAYDRGEDIILVKQETSPADLEVMEVAEGILTLRGGLTSHAAIVARGLGTPAVCGAAEILISGDVMNVGDIEVSEGDVLSLDGTSGEVFVGTVLTAESEESLELNQILTWADQIRAGKMSVRANVDTADDARKALALGAEGIGLCRTEHQFLGDRLPLIQAMILARNNEEEAAALEPLSKVQQSDFFELLKVMDGLPVTIRLLDPPLHEFLPDESDFVLGEHLGTLTDREHELRAAAKEWREENPMLGTRGVRLGILRPALYRMQAKAVMLAGHRLVAQGGAPQIEIMIPLIINRQELDLVRSWIEDEVTQANLDAPTELAVKIGSMIETPRAALCSDVIAAGADFFSFGTNDLTQMTLGFSRDDVETRVVSDYVARSILGANPFETLDIYGVGALVRSAALGARRSNPTIKLGVCGEHGGDPASIQHFWDCGLDYVSCSVYRVPVARLAAAQAIVTRAADLRVTEAEAR